jgi:hypothetical protein
MCQVIGFVKQPAVLAGSVVLVDLGGCDRLLSQA